MSMTVKRKTLVLALLMPQRLNISNPMPLIKKIIKGWLIIPGD